MSATLAKRIRQELRKRPNKEFVGTSENLANLLGVSTNEVNLALRWARDNCLTTKWTVMFNRTGSYRLIETFTPANLQAIYETNSALSQTVLEMTIRRNKQVQLMVNRAVRPGTAKWQAASDAVRYLNAAERELFAAATA